LIAESTGCRNCNAAGSGVGDSRGRDSIGEVSTGGFEISAAFGALIPVAGRGDAVATGGATDGASLTVSSGASEGDGSLAFTGAGVATSQHDGVGHGQQQQQRRFAKNRHAAAGSTSSKQTEIQTSTTCVIFRSRFIASNSP
jgi:hypothetical protein